MIANLCAGIVVRCSRIACERNCGNLFHFRDTL